MLCCVALLRCVVAVLRCAVLQCIASCLDNGLLCSLNFVLHHPLLRPEREDGAILAVAFAVNMF